MACGLVQVAPAPSEGRDHRPLVTGAQGALVAPPLGGRLANR